MEQFPYEPELQRSVIIRDVYGIREKGRLFTSSRTMPARESAASNWAALTSESCRPSQSRHRSECEKYRVKPTLVAHRCAGRLGSYGRDAF
jgi:hypothetical protein